APGLRRDGRRRVRSCRCVRCPGAAQRAQDRHRQPALGVLAKPDSRFARKKELKLFDLSGERVILSDNSLMLGISVEDAFSRSLIELTRRSRTNSIGLMVEMANMNLGTVLQTRVGIER